MDEKKEKQLAKAIVQKARSECIDKKIDSHIAVSAFLDGVIRELIELNSEEKVANFLESFAKKVRMGLYNKK